MGIIALGSLLKGQFKLVKSSSLITGEVAGNGPWEGELIWGLQVGDMEEGDSLVVVVKCFSSFCSRVPGVSCKLL